MPRPSRLGRPRPGAAYPAAAPDLHSHRYGYGDWYTDARHPDAHSDRNRNLRENADFDFHGHRNRNSNQHRDAHAHGDSDRHHHHDASGESLRDLDRE